MANALNEKTKRRYFTILRGAKGYSDSTIAIIETALHMFEQSTEYKDFKTFSERQATRFKSWLEERTNRGRRLSTTSQYHHLRHVKAFLAWLSTQQGFRSRISLDAVSFLTLDRRSQNEALAVKPRKFPSLEQVRSLVASITIKTEMDRRDRALISFMLLTGMRYMALCSLPVGCLDVENQIVYQYPRKGVRTKNGKAINTLLLPFDDTMVLVIKDWVTYLSEVRKFSPTAPLFPRTKVTQAPDGTAFEANDVEPIFWQGGSSIRSILKSRSEAAGLPYFNPHSFRHAHVQIALKCCRTPEELKALSQNIGHEQVMTTLSSYGTLDDQRVSDVLGGMDFTGKSAVATGSIPADELERFMRRFKRND